MRLFAVFTIMFVCIAAIFHFMFIMFDYAYYNPDSGALIKMTEAFNETLSTKYQNDLWNQTVMLREAFGYGRFGFFASGLIIFAVGVFDDRRSKGGG